MPQLIILYSIFFLILERAEALVTAHSSIFSLYRFSYFEFESMLKQL